MAKHSDTKSCHTRPGKPIYHDPLISVTTKTASLLTPRPPTASNISASTPSSPIRRAAGDTARTRDRQARTRDKPSPGSLRGVRLLPCARLTPGSGVSPARPESSVRGRAAASRAACSPSAPGTSCHEITRSYLFIFLQLLARIRVVHQRRERAAVRSHKFIIACAYSCSPSAPGTSCHAITRS